MTQHKKPEDVTLIDVLIDGFERNEIWYGFHGRELPMSNDAIAIRKFAAFVDEARRWKGVPLRDEVTAKRRLVVWQDLELRQMGRAILVRVRAPEFSRWWHEEDTWKGDPMGPIFEWLQEEQKLGQGLK